MVVTNLEDVLDDLILEHVFLHEHNVEQCCPDDIFDLWSRLNLHNYVVSQHENRSE